MKREEAEATLDQVICSRSHHMLADVYIFSSYLTFKVVESCLDPGFAPIAAILLQAQASWEVEMCKDDNSQALSKEVFSRANSSELFDIKIIAVSSAARGLGLATDLVMRSLQLAKCLGYRWVLASVTSLPASEVPRLKLQETTPGNTLCEQQHNFSPSIFC